MCAFLLIFSSFIKDIQSNATKTQKEFAKFEREYIELEEKKKHLKQKKKKLEKAIEKESHSRSENEIWSRNHQQDLAKKTLELEALNQTLQKAEDDLNQIRESLKGTFV